jgi:MinD superfamily P-loop ATPase
LDDGSCKLGIAQENSGKLVTIIRKRSQKNREEQNKQLLLIDGRRASLSVIASSAGRCGIDCNRTTLSGLHDLHRVADLAKISGSRRWSASTKRTLIRK